MSCGIRTVDGNADEAYDFTASQCDCELHVVQIFRDFLPYPVDVGRSEKVVGRSDASPPDIQYSGIVGGRCWS